MAKAKIFLLEDDVNLSDTVIEFLEDKEYEVVPAYDSDEAEEILYESGFDLYLLDVNVPGINGFELLKKVRDENSEVPAIFLTSLNSIEDVEKGYDSGCDDYIKKPFELKELLLRIETLLKRRFLHVKSSRVKIDEDIEYDMLANTLYVKGKEIALHNKEAKLLKLFLQKKGEIIPHEIIYDTLWEYDEVSSDSALRTYIKNLRKIIGKDKIVSLKKLGYKFTTE